MKEIIYNEEKIAAETAAIAYLFTEELKEVGKN